VAWPARSFRGERLDLAALEPSLLRAEQSNTSVIYGDRWILKLFRRNTDEGLNPDLEIGLFLTTKASFPYTPAVDGALEYQRPRGGSRTLGILQRFVHNEGDAWRYTLDTLGTYFEEALTRTPQPGSLPAATGALVDMSEKEIPPACEEVIGPYMESARLLGQRTGELHLALASERTDPIFAPEPFTALDRRSLYQSFRTSAAQSLTALKRRQTSLPEDTRAGARKIVSLEKEILKRFHAVVEQNITGMRIRCHGDYHLGQVLYTGKDFIIIDFEGEPARPIGERRLKRSPLRDIAGMLRSFHYAAVTKLRSGEFRPEDAPALQPWAEFWRLWVSVAFLKSYFETTREADLLPKRKAETATSLDLYLLEKVVYEIRYELNHRPDWVSVPIQGILELLPTSS
jgi:maltose alpha-D-glucosyltransferase/alpha-amylase